MTSALHQWFYEFKRYLQPGALILFLLGFSAGLPLLLVMSTLSAWLKESGLEYRSIGFFAWVGLAFSIKVVWAPIVDRLSIPILQRLGQRRSWMLLAQIGIAVGLAVMASLSPGEQTLLLAGVAVFVAFCAATQDVSIDAYRIQAYDTAMQAIVTTAYIAGYRIAMLVAGAGALFIADGYSWEFSYQVMAGLMSVGILTALFMKEPKSTSAPNEMRLQLDVLEQKSALRFPDVPTYLHRIIAWIWLNVIRPFAEMVIRFGRWFLLLMAVVLFYRVSDIAMGNMANPFYLALGYTKTDIAWVTKIFGFFMVLLGSVVGGVLVSGLGLFRSMLFCLSTVIITNLLFAALAVAGESCLSSPLDLSSCQAPALWWLAAVISADNLAGGASNVVFIAFLSNQVNVSYSATQYALLSSLMTFLGKFISGFSGIVVESFGFPIFFVYVSVLGIPSMLLLLALHYWRSESFTMYKRDSEPESRQQD